MLKKMTSDGNLNKQCERGNDKYLDQLKTFPH